MENFYNILEINENASQEQIKKSYRQLSLKYHPDRNKDEEATKIFIKISRAYEFLDKEENRKLYAEHMNAIAEEKKRIEAMG